MLVVKSVHAPPLAQPHAAENAISPVLPDCRAPPARTVASAKRVFVMLFGGLLILWQQRALVTALLRVG